MDDKNSIRQNIGAPCRDIHMDKEPGKGVSFQSVAEVLNNPLHVVQSMLVSCNANFMDMRDGILEWEATHPLKN